MTNYSNGPKVHAFKFPADEALKSGYMPIEGTTLYQHNKAR